MIIEVDGCSGCPFLYSESEYEEYLCRVPGSSASIHRDGYYSKKKLSVWLGKCPLDDGPITVRKV